MARNFGSDFGRGVLNVARAMSPTEEKRQAGMETREGNRKTLMRQFLMEGIQNGSISEEAALPALKNLGMEEFIGDQGSLISREPSKAEGSFGNSIQGRSQQIMMDTQTKINSGIPLSPFEKMQREFAGVNITAPRDTVNIDPVTSQKSIITIRPEMPSMFLDEQVTGTPTPKPQPRVKTTVIEPQKYTKQSRIEAQAELKAMTRAKKSVMELLSYVARNPNVVGTRGKVKRLLSGAGGQVGMNFDTKATSFKTKLGAVHSDLRVLIDEGRFSDEDRKRLEELVKGTGFLDSTQDTIASYNEVINLITGKIDSANQTLGNLPEGVTEANIRFTMKKHKLTRKQVLEKYNARRSSGR